MFDLGIQELIVIFVVALIVFGPKRLPELGRTLGKGLAELKKALQDVREQVNVELKEPPETLKDQPPGSVPEFPEPKGEGKAEEGESQSVHDAERKDKTAG